ncbi:2-oxoglutarate dehydrogenase E1 subunit family protein, partial [Arthrobacter sp. H14]|uniref:2-oxoglutarate dehydrogenase E1 subunit family protein n=1 Tax=Arthrobacter sp. H14 TaxID=1312959 RepID=UPI0005604D3D
MPDQPNHRIPEEFSGNEWLVDELYEEYKKDKNSVDKKWWSIFESFDDSGSSNGRHSSDKSGSDGGKQTKGDGGKSRSSSDETGE